MKQQKTSIFINGNLEITNKYELSIKSRIEF
jgi:hypothetical protein